MKHQTRLALAGLLSAVVLAAGACAGAGGGAESMDQGEKGKDGSGATEGAESSGMQGMDHNPGGAATRRLMENGKYSDERFIDEMVPHHQGAVEMAEVAQKESDNPRIKELSGNIIEAQERELSRMQTWRESWYPAGRKGADDAR